MGEKSIPPNISAKVAGIVWNFCPANIFGCSYSIKIWSHAGIINKSYRCELTTAVAWLHSVLHGSVHMEELWMNIQTHHKTVLSNTPTRSVRSQQTVQLLCHIYNIIKKITTITLTIPIILIYMAHTIIQMSYCT